MPSKVIELDLNKVWRMSIFITAGSAILLLTLFAVINGGLAFGISFGGILLFFIGYVLLIVAHEFFHLMGFRIFGNIKWKEMEYGVNLKMGVAYATTSKPIQNKAMKKALMLPFWTTGVLPAVIGFIIGSPGLIFLSAWLIGGAAGDFAMYKELRKTNSDAWIRDDPKEPKLYVYEI